MDSAGALPVIHATARGNGSQIHVAWRGPDYSVRVPQPTEASLVDSLWAASQDADNAAFRPRRGWWSLAAWATHALLLLEDGAPVGVAAINVGTAPGDAEARLALLPGRRHRRPPRLLVAAAIDLAAAAGTAVQLRIAIPAAAAWARGAAAAGGHAPGHAQHVMVRPAEAPAPAALPIARIHIRRLRPGEDPALLQALNRAWASTADFRPLREDALLADLRGQRSGMLVTEDMDPPGRIVGTVHAQFDAGRRNPTGGPYAWISNLTTDPDWRGRGLGRALLAAGLTHLRMRGAATVALGVDGGDPAPMALYRSAGFSVIDTVQTWECAKSPAYPGTLGPSRAGSDAPR